MLGAYYHDPSRPNPFEESTPSKTLLLPSLPALNTEVGITLNNLEDEPKKLDGSLKKSGTPYLHETTLSQFILQAVRATHTLSSQCHRAAHSSHCLLKMDVLR